MSQTKKAVALHTVHYAKDGKPAVAQPGEVFDLSEQTFDELVALGSVRAPRAGEEPSPLDHDNDGRPGGSIDELDQMKVEELREVAETEKVNLGDATKKADIIAAIRAGRTNDLLG